MSLGTSQRGDIIGRNVLYDNRRLRERDLLCGDIQPDILSRAILPRYYKAKHISHALRAFRSATNGGIQEREGERESEGEKEGETRRFFPNEHGGPARANVT